MADRSAVKTRSWVWNLVPGLAPQQTVSGARIHVNSSGTTSVDPGALSEIARRRFREMRSTDTAQVKQTG